MPTDGPALASRRRAARLIVAYSMSISQRSGGVALRQIAEEVADPRDRLGQVCEAVGVREPHIAFAMGAKAGARDRRDPGLFQQLRLEFLGVVAGAGDVGEGVEGAARVGAAEAGE